MNRQKLLNMVFVCNFIIFLAIIIALIYKMELMEAQIESQQGQINTFRQLIFNLYGKNGG